MPKKKGGSGKPSGSLKRMAPLRKAGPVKSQGAPAPVRRKRNETSKSAGVPQSQLPGPVAPKSRPLRTPKPKANDSASPQVARPAPMPDMAAPPVDVDPAEMPVTPRPRPPFTGPAVWTDSKVTKKRNRRGIA